MRNAFSASLTLMGQADPNVLLLTGDHGYNLFDDFRRICPNQYINAGVAEQNMIGLAAGLAKLGFRPFVYGLSAFVPVRVLEQIKLDIAHDNLPVVLLGDGAGFVYSHLGTSHQSTEDIACTRAVPLLTILSPADQHEMTACMELAYNLKSPVYLRIGKSDLGDTHHRHVENLRLGDLLNLRLSEKSDIALIATGSMVKTALTIADFHIEASVWSAPSIKPLNSQQLVQIAQKNNCLVVLEEHSVMGGLGSAVTEILSEIYPSRILRIGVLDRFSEYCGTYEYLLHEHELDKNSIINKIHKFLKAS
jgi:transketolase